MEAVMVEILNRLGRVRWRQRLDTFPASIGRSPSCEVIVDEHDVSAVHARVVRAPDGGLVLEDAGSANGTYVGTARLSSVALGQKTEVRLGSARLRFVSADAPVEKTWVGVPPRGARQGIVAIVALALLGVSPLVDRFFRLASAPNVADELGEGLLLLIAACGWAYTWALATHTFRGTLRFVEHLLITTVGLVAIAYLGAMALPVLGYSLDAAGPIDGVREVATGVIVAAMLSGHLARASQLSPWRSRAIGAAVVGILALLVVAQRVGQSQKPSGALPIEGIVMPPGWLVRSPKPPEALFSQLDGLKADVDTLRAEGRPP